MDPATAQHGVDRRVSRAEATLGPSPAKRVQDVHIRRQARGQRPTCKAKEVGRRPRCVGDTDTPTAVTGRLVGQERESGASREKDEVSVKAVGVPQVAKVEQRDTTLKPRVLCAQQSACTRPTDTWKDQIRSWSHALHSPGMSSTVTANHPDISRLPRQAPAQTAMAPAHPRNRKQK